jgi:hypothetical protein
LQRVSSCCFSSFGFDAAREQTRLAEHLSSFYQSFAALHSTIPYMSNIYFAALSSAIVKEATLCRTPMAASNKTAGDSYFFVDFTRRLLYNTA